MNQIKNYTLPVLVLLSGIFLSTISAYYSILGLVSIFSGSVFLITLMGISLECGKIASCLWLHKHWKDKIGFLKLYLSVAIVILMIITSLGVYGFLTKANLKQSEGVNLNLAKVTALESNIEREQSRLSLNSTQITQYNDLLSKLITKDVRRASNERRRIQSEIKVLAKESKEITKSIDNLNTELLPYKSEINAVEVEVGTLLYISKLIYGDNYKEYLPQTLTVLTLLIIFVFDPLAIGLLIASQKSFGMIPFEDKRSKRNGRLPIIAEHKLREDSDPEYKTQMEEARSKLIIKPQDEILTKELIDGVAKECSLLDLKLDRSKITPFDNFKSDTLTLVDKEKYDEIVNHHTNSPIRVATEDEEGALRDTLNNILNKQEPLGEEFDKVLDDNRWELYESDEPFQGLESVYDEPKIDTENVDEVEQEEDVEAIGRMRKGYRRTSRKI